MGTRPAFIRNLQEVEVELHYLDLPAERYRSRRRLGKATGAQRIGINYCYLQPGQVSSKFHFHSKEEEFFYVLSGRARLRYGNEEYTLGAGDAVSIRPGGLGHQLRNDFKAECRYLAIGIRDSEDSITYPVNGNRK